MKIVATADLHIRDTCPIARIDGKESYIQEQIDCLKFIGETCETHDAGLYIAGDIFHKPVVSAKWIHEIDKHFHSVYVRAIPGQHDLINHSIDNWDCCSLSLLEYHENFFLIDLPMNTLVFMDTIKDAYIYLIHQLFYDKEKPFPNAPDEGNMKSFLKKHDDGKKKIFISGDNHKPAIVRYKNMLHVNCGSMMRMTADQHDYQPCIHLIDTETLEVESIPLPTKLGTISREHIEDKKKKEVLSAFVEEMTKFKNEKISLDFVENLNLAASQFDNKVKEKICQMIEQLGN